MSIYQEFKLGEQANKYVRKCLENSKSLGRLLVTMLDQKQGQVITFLPQNVDPKKMLEFGYGGIANGDETLSYLITKIQEYLVTDSNYIYIFEDMLVQRKDRWLSSSTLPMFFSGSDVYYFLGQRHQDNVETIRQVASTLESHTVIGVMTSLPINRNLIDEKQEISREDLNGLANGIEMIAVGAYDNEGYLIWSKV